MATRIHSRFSWAGVFAALALGIASLQFSILHYEQRGPLLDELMEYRAPLPFQARVLPVIIANTLLQITEGLGIDRENLTNMLFLGIDALALLAAALMVYSIARREFSSVGVARITAAVLVVNLTVIYLLARGTRYFYPSDILAVAFFALFLYGVERRWSIGTLCAVVFVACFNRETILLAIPLYAIHGILTSLEQKRVLRGLILLLGCWLLAKVILYFMFMENPGVTMSFRRGSWDPSQTEPGSVRFLSNFSFLLRPESLINFLATVGLTWGAAILAARQARHRFGHYLIVLPLYVVTMAMVANFDEVRVFGETAVVCSLALGALAGAYAKGFYFCCNLEPYLVE